MGMNIGSSSPTAVKSDINVTPLIDVLLVLLIIFLVTLPILMKMETLDVPRNINENEQVPEDSVLLIVKVHTDTQMTFCDGNKKNPVTATDIAHSAGGAAELRSKLEQQKNGKVVFVDFDDGVPWETVVSTMDAIRALASDVSHNEIKVALRVREPAKPGEPKGPCDDDNSP